MLGRRSTESVLNKRVIPAAPDQPGSSAQSRTLDPPPPADSPTSPLPSSSGPYTALISGLSGLSGFLHGRGASGFSRSPPQVYAGFTRQGMLRRVPLQAVLAMIEDSSSSSSSLEWGKPGETETWQRVGVFVHTTSEQSSWSARPMRQPVTRELYVT